MDLCSSLLVRREGELVPLYTSMDPRGLGYFNSMGDHADIPSSSPPEMVSSQGFSTSQTMPGAFEPRNDENDRPGFMEMRETTNALSSTPNLQSIEDFDAAFPYTPRERLIPIVSSKPTGDITTNFAHQCDQHGVRPFYTFAEISQGQFTAKVQIGNEAIEITDPQPSKKHAKEEVCKLALERMPKVEKMEGMEKKGKKRKSGEALENVQPKRDDSENWIGMLNIHCQRNHFLLPAYEDARTAADPPQFSSAVTIGDRPNLTFSSGMQTFSNKKDAKFTAAKSAVLWLRGQGKLVENPQKRQRIMSTDGSSSTTTQSGPNNEDWSQTGNHNEPPSIFEQVHSLVASLGLTMQPRWVSRPSKGHSGETFKGTGTFIDMAAYFDDRDSELESRLQGPIGEVNNCFGQKQAKKACCERVLPVLEAIKRDRLAAGR